MIFNNSEYFKNNDDIYIMIVFLKNKHKISRLNISNMLNISYSTYSRAEINKFNKHKKLMLQVKEILEISNIDDINELEQRSDERFKNYLYNKKSDVELKSENNFSIIQDNILRLIESNYREKKYYDELLPVKELLNSPYKFILEIASAIYNHQEIPIYMIDNHLRCYSLYIRLKSFYKKEEYYDFLLNVSEVKMSLIEYLAIDRLIEISFLEIISLYKINKTNEKLLDNLKQYKQYEEEVKIIEVLFYIKNEKYKKAIKILENLEVQEKNLIIKKLYDINQTFKILLNQAFLNEKKQVNLKKTKIYEFVIKELNLF